MDNWEIALSVMMGVGLSAACGFRVFIPPLVLCIAGKAGHVIFGQDMSPWLKWSLAAIAGGGAAGALQLTTTVTRGASSALTGGTANWLVSTGEGVGAVITAILAIVVPVLVFIGLLMLAGYIIYRNPLKLYREWRQRNAPDEPVSEPPVMAA